MSLGYLEKKIFPDVPDLPDLARSGQIWPDLGRLGKFFFQKKFYFSFLQNFTHNAFWFLEDTQGAGFYDKHGTTLHLFVIYIVSRAIHGETFRVETRDSPHQGLRSKAF